MDYCEDSVSINSLKPPWTLDVSTQLTYVPVYNPQQLAPPKPMQVKPATVTCLGCQVHWPKQAWWK